MQRSLNARAQAELVEAFVTSCGGKPQHTAVLELVARLNGAPNWNALERPARDSGFIKKIRQLLSPWAERFELRKELASFRPDPKPSGPAQAVMHALFQVCASCQQEQTKSAWKSTAGLLNELSQAALELRHQVLRQGGHNRTATRPQGQGYGVYSMETSMLDEERPWQIELDGALVDVTHELLEEVLADGVVAEATVEFPRADRYGVPELASVSAIREYLWEQGFMLAIDIDIGARDREDDGVEECKIAILLPEDLVQRIREHAAAG